MPQVRAIPPRKPRIPMIKALSRLPRVRRSTFQFPARAAIQRQRLIWFPAAPRSARQRLTTTRSEEHTSELQSRLHLVCRLLLEKTNSTHHRSFLTRTCSAKNHRIDFNCEVEIQNVPCRILLHNSQGNTDNNENRMSTNVHIPRK